MGGAEVVKASILLELRAIFFLDFERQTLRIDDPITDISIPFDFDPLTGGLVESGITKIGGMRISIIETTEPVGFFGVDLDTLQLISIRIKKKR